MIALHVEAPFSTFRRSYARTYGETYPVAPPATLFGMLLSLCGEYQRRRHLGVRIASAYRGLPARAATLRRLTRYKYGVASKQAAFGSAPDYVEVLCELDAAVFVDSSAEQGAPTLEQRLAAALADPASARRTGILCLGLSDDMVDVSPWRGALSARSFLRPDPSGPLDLPVWVDHVGSADTRNARFTLLPPGPDGPDPSYFTQICAP